MSNAKEIDTTAPGQVQKQKSAPQLMPSRFSLAEYQRSEWVANVEHGVSIDDVIQPEFWAHNAASMRPYDHIEVRAEDGSWIAKLLVLGSDRNWARVKLLHEYHLTTADVSLSQAMKHQVKWQGPHHKYSVIRLSDQECVRNGFDDKNEAARWLIEHEKVVG